MQKNVFVLAMLCAVSMSGMIQAMDGEMTDAQVRTRAKYIDVTIKYALDGKTPEQVLPLQQHLEGEFQRVGELETGFTALSRRVGALEAKKPTKKLDWKEWGYAKCNEALPWITAGTAYSCLMQHLHVPIVDTIKPLAARSAALLLSNMPLVGKVAEKAVSCGVSSVVSRATPMVTGVVAGTTFAFNVAKDVYCTPLITTRIAWNRWFGMKNDMNVHINEDAVTAWAQKLTRAQKTGLNLLATWDASKKHGADLLWKGFCVAAGAAVLMAHGYVYSLHNK